MKKNLVRVTESQLHNIVNESVKRLIQDNVVKETYVGTMRKNMYGQNPNEKSYCAINENEEEEGILGGIKGVGSYISNGIKNQIGKFRDAYNQGSVQQDRNKKAQQIKQLRKQAQGMGYNFTAQGGQTQQPMQQAQQPTQQTQQPMQQAQQPTQQAQQPMQQAQQPTQQETSEIARATKELKQNAAKNGPQSPLGQAFTHLANFEASMNQLLPLLKQKNINIKQVNSRIQGLSNVLINAETAGIQYENKKNRKKTLNESVLHNIIMNEIKKLK